MRGSGGSTFSLAYDGGSGTTPTLAQVSKIYSGTFSFDNNHNGVVTNYGSWKPTTTFSVSSAGAVSGTVACWTIPVCTSAPCPTVTCNVSGTLTPRTDLNAYDAVLSFGSTSGGATPMDGTYDGIAYYDTETGRLYLAGISSATNHGIGFR